MNGSWSGTVPGRGTGTSASAAAMPSGGVFMLALLTWLASGRPPAGVRAVDRLALHGVAVDRLEVAGGPGEADRRLRQVVVELAEEVEQLDRVLLGLARQEFGTSGSQEHERSRAAARGRR